MGSARGACSLGSDSARASIVFTSGLYLRSTGPGTSSFTGPLLPAGKVLSRHVCAHGTYHAIGRGHIYLLYRYTAARSDTSLHRRNVYGSQILLVQSREIQLACAAPRRGGYWMHTPFSPAAGSLLSMLKGLATCCGASYGSRLPR